MRVVLAALLIGLAVFGLVLLIGRQGPEPGASAAGPDLLRRDKGEGGVEIEVLYATPDYVRTSNDRALQKYDPDRNTVFVVAMNTHTVDLSAYDMVKISELVAGGKRHAPLRWQSTSDNAHHRSGVLIFPKIQPPFPVELLIKTVAGIPVRRLQWAP